MILSRLTKTILILVLAVCTAFAAASCGGNSSKDTTTAESTTVATTTVTPTPSVPAISGTLSTNTQAVTWIENAINPGKTMYVNVEADFLRVRTGPGTDYKQVAALTDGMTVTVVAMTDTNWYKLSDGYYVFGDYLSDQP